MRYGTGLTFALLAGASLAALLGSGCGDDSSPPPPGPSLLAIAVSPDSLEFSSLSGSLPIEVTGTTTAGLVDLTDDAATVYTSRDESVVTVDASGVVTPVGDGETYVVASHSGLADSAFANVTAVTLTAVDVSPDTLVLPVLGARIQVEVTGSTTGGPIDLTSSPFTSYVSRDQGVVGVSAGGSVNAVAEGETWIVATNSGLSDSALAVVDLGAILAVDSIAVSPTTVSFVSTGETRATTSTIFWENGARWDGNGPPVGYLSDDELIASVDASGVIEAVGEGSTTITASFGGKSATVSVTVAHQYSFANEIHPIFTGPEPIVPSQNNCVGFLCHIDAGGSPGGGLQLDTWEHLMDGGDVGAVVIPGDGANSFIVRALRWEIEQRFNMPQGRNQLPDTTIAKIELWIDQGAPNN